MSGFTSSDRPADADGALYRAFNEALAFPVSRVNAIAMSSTQAMELAEQEANFGTVAIDEAGMSGGMRLNLLRPVQDLASDWRGLWNNFYVAIEPKRRDIEAVERLDADIAAEKEKRDQALVGLERNLEASTKYRQTKDDYLNAEIVYKRFRDTHRGIDANMRAKHWFYWISFVFVLATESFINYNAFTAFWNGVEFAGLGTTLVIGVVLALASHVHGEYLKQWAYRFGRERRPEMRFSDWRMFGFSTSALLLVLTFTGWSRWSLAAASLGSDSQASALGSSGISVNPVQEVGISLLANLAAWALGVIIAYFAHDHDPDYMEATAQLWRHREPYNKQRNALLVERRHVEARYAKEIENKTNEAESKRSSVAREIDMVNQVKSRNAAVQRELQLVAARNVETYRDALVRVAVAQQGRVQIVRAGTNTPFSPFDYKTMNIAPPYMAEAAA